MGIETMEISMGNITVDPAFPCFSRESSVEILWDGDIYQQYDRGLKGHVAGNLGYLYLVLCRGFPSSRDDHQQLYQLWEETVDARGVMTGSQPESLRKTWENHEESNG